jgi:hypothetical protein
MIRLKLSAIVFVPVLLFAVGECRTRIRVNA